MHSLKRTRPLHKWKVLSKLPNNSRVKLPRLKKSCLKVVPRPLRVPLLLWTLRAKKSFALKLINSNKHSKPPRKKKSRSPMRLVHLLLPSRKSKRSILTRSLHARTPKVKLLSSKRSWLLVEVEVEMLLHRILNCKRQLKNCDLLWQRKQKMSNVLKLKLNNGWLHLNNSKHLERKLCERLQQKLTSCEKNVKFGKLNTKKSSSDEEMQKQSLILQNKNSMILILCFLD
mmetsp:Transcript_3887/g.5823  ORF Transcript_3887/g.5823 Transcript_3887/m.5823 type:complete len:229 (-) Transcript_3887:45-731(-)